LFFGRFRLIVCLRPPMASSRPRCGSIGQSGQDSGRDIMRFAALMGAAAVLAISGAYAATSYDGNGQVPQQFVLSGKAADRLHDHISINLATAEKMAAACEAIAKKNNSQVVVVIL